MLNKTRAISIALVAGLLFATPSFANPAKQNSSPGSASSNSQSKAPAVAASPNTQVAEKKVEEATNKALEAKEQASAKKEEATAMKQEAQQAVAASAEAAQDAKAAKEQAAKASPEAAAQARSAAELAQARADQAAAEAKAKAAAASTSAQSAAAATAAAKKAEALAIVLSKIKGAQGECIEFVETSAKTALAECITSRYVIRFNAGVDADLQVKGMRALKIPVQATLKGVFSGAVADLNAGQLKALVASNRIQSIEQDFVIKLNSTQDNPTWGLDRVDQVNLPLSKTYTNTKPGAGVKAYVVDTGILASHTDFGGRVVSGFTAVNDGRGTTDCNGHGTHVAGTVAGAAYGVAKQAQLVAVRVLDCNGSGYLSSVVNGLDWIAKNHGIGTPGVVNMSLGGGASSTLDSAVESLVSKGIPVVVAAGNSAASACTASPARTPGAITVAASSATDVFASFSNFGSCVDVIAPGVDVRSAWISSNTSTAILNGTSMAAPHVAGVVASLLSDGYLTPGSIDYQLKQGSATGKISNAPAETPNLLVQLVTAAAPVVTEPSSPETAPISESATAPIAPYLTGVSGQKNAARVNWNISPDGGSPILSHTVRVWENGVMTRAIQVSATATSLRVSGLKTGVAYTFTVVATNAIGTSMDSNTSAIYKASR
jgi:subtilisin family serine protease